METNLIIKTFFAYAFLGWAVENIGNWKHKDFISCNPIMKFLFSKNFCFVPFLLAYGIGGIFIMYLWKKYPHLSLLYKLIIFAIGFNVIEIISGYVGEKYICNKINTCEEKNKMWNYNNTTNLNGYVDIEHTIYWILIGYMGYIIYPYIENIAYEKMILLMIIIWIIISVFKYPIKIN